MPNAARLLLSRSALILRDVEIEETPYHPLILRVVTSGFSPEEVDATLAQGDRDLHGLLLEREFLWRRKEVFYQLNVTDFDVFGLRTAKFLI